MALSRASLAKVLASGASYSGLHGSFLPSSIRPDPTSGTLNPPRRVSYTLQELGIRIRSWLRWGGGESQREREREKEKGSVTVDIPTDPTRQREQVGI